MDHPVHGWISASSLMSLRPRTRRPIFHTSTPTSPLEHRLPLICNVSFFLFLYLDYKTRARHTMLLQTPGQACVCLQDISHMVTQKTPNVINHFTHVYSRMWICCADTTMHALDWPLTCTRKQQMVVGMQSVAVQNTLVDWRDRNSWRRRRHSISAVALQKKPHSSFPRRMRAGVSGDTIASSFLFFPPQLNCLVGQASVGC